MKKTLIFSDVHLKVSPAGRDLREQFVAFLRGISPREYDRVICLGDLFDFWFEYRHAVFSGYFEVLRAFANLREAGIELHLVCGNHDFWGGRFLRETLGFHVHESTVDLPFGGRTAHLVHGDGINADDWVYRTYKCIARNPLVVGAFRLLHPDWAISIARAVSHGSRTMGNHHDPAEGPEAKALSAYARAVLAQGRADIVLCGHSHAPVRETHPTPDGEGLYLNPGDWLSRRSYVVWDGRDFELVAPEGTARPAYK